jgi:hypothetical protein
LVKLAVGLLLDECLQLPKLLGVVYGVVVPVLLGLRDEVGDEDQRIDYKLLFCFVQFDVLILVLTAHSLKIVLER